MTIQTWITGNEIQPSKPTLASRNAPLSGMPGVGIATFGELLQVRSEAQWQECLLSALLTKANSRVPHPTGTVRSKKMEWSSVSTEGALSPPPNEVREQTRRFHG